MQGRQSQDQDQDQDQEQEQEQEFIWGVHEVKSSFQKH